MPVCCGVAGLWLQAAGGCRAQQLPEQGQALHPTAPSGMGREEPEKSCQPKRWLYADLAGCVQPISVK